MRLYTDPLSYGSVAELLQEAAARTGFSTSEMQDLLDSELTITQLIDYIDAVVSQRMN
jgi:hypothetical protein